MELNENLTTDYRDQLIKLFNFLRTETRIIDSHSDIRQVSETAYFYLKKMKKEQSSQWSINVQPNFQIKVNVRKNNYCGPKGDTYLNIGGLVQVLDNKIVNQSFALSLTFTPTCNLAGTDTDHHACPEIDCGKTEVVRRFHFDFDPTLNSQSWPYSHLQYGGDFNSEHIQEKEAAYRLFKAIDLPRLPSPPYDLVLLLDIFFKQFPVKAKDVTKETVWRNMVKCSEKLWLKPYYSKLFEHVNATGDDKSAYDLLCEQPIHR